MLLAEAFRLLQLESEDVAVYTLSNEQKSALNEAAREQIKRGEFVTDGEAATVSER